MSEYGWYEQEQQQGQVPEEETPKGMRKQIQDLAAKLAERDAALAELQKESRQRNVMDALSGMGLPNPEKIARLVPADVAGKPDALKTWVEDYKDVFAPTSTAGNTSDESGGTEQKGSVELPADQVAAFQRMQTADASAGNSAPDLESSHLAALIAARNAAVTSGGGVDDYIAILRGEREI